MSVGLLILRVIVGALFIGHGTQKLFGWFGGHGRKGTGGFYESIGYRPGEVMATAAGMSEAGGGLMLMLGFLTPLGAAAIIGVMLNATLAVHWPKVWNTEGGFELPLALAAAATALAFAGPGRYSIDRALGWNLSGIPYGIGAVALGVVTGLLVYTWRMVQSGRAAASQESLQQGEGQRPAA